MEDATEPLLEQSRAAALKLSQGAWQLEVELLPIEQPPEPVAAANITEARPLVRSNRTPTRLLPNQVPALETPPPVEQILEALLFVGGPALSLAAAGQVVRGFSEQQLQETFQQLNAKYRCQNRPYTIEQTAAGYQLVERPQFRDVKERLFGGPREARLSSAALDVLSLVAYRQPISKAELDGLRGQDCTPPLRQLVRLGLLTLHREETSDGSATYHTTPRFLELFGLTSLDELPRLGDTIR